MDGGDWDADKNAKHDAESVPALVVIAYNSDDDGDVADDWDADSDTEAKEKANAVKVNSDATQKNLTKAKPTKVKSKKQKEEQKKQEMVEEEIPPPTREQQLRIEEEAALLDVKDAFGVDVAPVEDHKSLDRFEPKSAEDFGNYHQLLIRHISGLQKSPHYPNLIKDLIRSLATDLNMEDLRLMQTAVSTLVQEKQKKERAAKGGNKKSKKGVSLMDDRNERLVDREADFDDDFDIF